MPRGEGRASDDQGMGEKAAMRIPDPRVGIFSTLPIEVLLAAGRRPVDVNNLFVTHPDPSLFLRRADSAGLPRALCAWTRGLLGAVISWELQTVVVVPQGDCSNNTTLAALLERLGIRVLEFNFPVAPLRRRERMGYELDAFRRALSVSREKLDETFESMRPVRGLLEKMEALCWAERRLPGTQARHFLLQSTDMGGDPKLFSRRLEKVIGEFSKAPVRSGPRVALFGVPNLVSDLAGRIEGSGAILALCETEHDFAMIPPAPTLEEQYLNYAYPYGVEARLEKFLRLAEEREIDGVVVYTQAFCHHNLELARVQEALSEYPTVVIEADVPGPLSQRDLTRLEGFISLLRKRAPRGGVAFLSVGESGVRKQFSSPPLGEGRKGELCGCTTAAACAAGVRLALDLGSRFVKVLVEIEGALRFLAVDTIEFYRTFSCRMGSGLSVDMERLARALGLPEGAVPSNVVSTGYGRHLVKFENSQTVPEIQAHAAGAIAQCSHQKFLLIDLGGQDTKGLIVEDGRVVDFVMNDKCAAGSGRYVENMARLLGVPVEELTACSENPVELTTVCATFGESEVIGKIVEGREIPSICAGIMRSVALRTVQLIEKLPGVHGLPVCLAGGLADSPALAVFLSEFLGSNSVAPLRHARFNGALGCLKILTETNSHPK